MSTQSPTHSRASDGPRKAGATAGLVIVATTAALVLLLVLVFAVAARGFGTHAPTVRMLNVPGDYPTIQAAVNAADAGDIVRVSPGTYHENLVIDKAITLTAGTFDQINPINNTSIIDGDGSLPTVIVAAGLSEMPTLRGFVIRHGSVGLQAHSSLIAEYNYFADSRLLAEYIPGSGGVSRGNVYFGGSDGAVRLSSPTRPFLLENNRILYSATNGVAVDLGTAQTPADQVEIDIWNNMILGSGRDGIQFIDHGNGPQDMNRRFNIVGNLVASSGGAGIGVTAADAPTSESNVAAAIEPLRVYNNTFYGNNFGISGSSNAVTFNNIIANSQLYGLWQVQGPGNSVAGYTLFFQNGTDAGQSNLSVGNILGADPLFVAPPNAGPDGMWRTIDDDFSGLLLQAGSPAIDRGVTQLVAADGEVVPVIPITGFAGGAPDLGWREYGSPIFMTPTPSATATPTLLASTTPLTPTIAATQTPATPTTPAPSATSPVATNTPASPTPATTVTVGPSPSPAPQVIIQAIAPTSAQMGSTLDVTIAGAGFQSGAAVTVEGGTGPAPQILDIQVISGNTVVITLQVPEQGSGGAWDIRITNPDGTSALLEDAFTVTS